MNIDRTTRRTFLKTSTALAALASAGGWPAVADADDFRFEPQKDLIPAPTDPQQWPEFRRKLDEWREQARRELKYDDASYRRPEFAWAASSFSCCFAMMCDEAFYDPRSSQYTVEAYLDQGLREFGGYDSILLWQAYPRIGVDDRNQFDFFRDMPGGLEKLRNVVEIIHNRGVRVYIDYNPWDEGTRREGKSDVEALVELVKTLQVDGVFLDTMQQGAVELRKGLDAVRPGVVMEGEGVVPLDRIGDHHASWAQEFADSEVPGVLRHKWYERRHMQHQIQRWDYDHTGELHAAWMNGSGIMVWENVFGSWLGWSPRDRSILRAMLPIQRRFAGLFAGERWTPLVPTEAPGVYASLWEGDGLRLWTLVNRTEKSVEGVLMKAKAVAGDQCFDLVAGREVTLKQRQPEWLVKGSIAPRGIGCFLAAAGERLDDGFVEFLRGQAKINALADFTATSPRRQTRLIPAAAAEHQPGIPAGMVEIPAATVDLKIEMRARECGFYDRAS